MNKVQVVIEVGEKTYEDIMYDYEHKPQNLTFWDKVIASGTPLPKEHGRLIDADDIDNHIVGHVDTRSCPTIIEADKAESEGNKDADSN